MAQDSIDVIYLSIVVPILALLWLYLAFGIFFKWSRLRILKHVWDVNLPGWATKADNPILFYLFGSTYLFASGSLVLKAIQIWLTELKGH